MSTLKTHNLQSPDANSVNIAMTPNAGIIVTGISTFTGTLNANGDVNLGNATSDTISATGRFDTDLVPSSDSAKDLGLNAVRWRNIYADTLYGDGANLTNLPPSAPVGGSASNKVFFENDKVVSVNYQITSTKNAMTAGPVSVNAGIAVTVPSGCSWTIV